MTSSWVRMSIGFKGGQVLALRVEQGALEALHKALSGGGWHQLEAEDGPVRLDLSQVHYVRTESEEPRVGFGA
jgi:hypothetical protein